MNSFFEKLIVSMINIIKIISVQIKILFFKNINECSKKNLIILKEKNNFLVFNFISKFLK